MSAIELSIETPEHDSVYTGSASVTFRGSATVPDELTELPLYYRWYSNLFYSGEDERYSMNEPAQTSADVAYSTTLSLGTHAIAYAVSDVAGESQSEFESIQYGAVTGGAEGDSKCLVHVFKANILLPLDNSSVSRSALVLEAEAPGQWGMSQDTTVGGPPYVVNEDYQAINRLQYRWCFEPRGGPSGRPALEYTPSPGELLFQPYDSEAPETDPTRVVYTPSVPTGAIGTYDITLYVEDNKGEYADNHSQEIRVNLT